MVRSGQHWDLGEPDLDRYGLPATHSIASKLGCIRPNRNMDIPMHCAFAEDEASLAELAERLEAQKIIRCVAIEAETGSNCFGIDCASSSELNYSNSEYDHYKTDFGNIVMAVSPEMNSFDYFPSLSENFNTQSLPVPIWFTPWAGPRLQTMSMNMETQQSSLQTHTYTDLDVLSHGLLETEFSADVNPCKSGLGSSTYLLK